LRLGGPARLFVEATRRGQVIDALRWAKQAGTRTLILGAGSNLVVPDDGIDGLVLRVGVRGIAVEPNGGHVLLTAQAGEPWQEVIETALAQNLSGIECLTGIPGLTGATPIQNVGAYGQEVADTIDGVEVLDRTTLEIRWMDTAECVFGYRRSVFKRAPDRHIVLSVRFRLLPNGTPTLHYPELARELSATGAMPSLRQVADSVYALRKQKSMVFQAGDENACSAGSFFMNPIVPKVKADAVRGLCVEQGLVREAEDVPCFVAPGGEHKLSAGWLIEQAGFAKGLRRGAFGISTRHALALVHHGGGSTRELLAFAAEIQGAVADRFGVELEIEPVRW
jgi:UDP-N-acetylmuramate dehydrogenase